MITKQELLEAGFSENRKFISGLWLEIDDETSIQFVEHRLIFWCGGHTRDLFFKDINELKLFINFFLNGLEFQSHVDVNKIQDHWSLTAIKNIVTLLVIAVVGIIIFFLFFKK